MLMSIILEVWDIHEDNIRIIKLFIDQKFIIKDCVLTYSGLARSTSVVENGGASLTRNSGNGGEQYGLPSNLPHTAHRCIMLLTRLLPCIIQYLALTSVTIM